MLRDGTARHSAEMVARPGLIDDEQSPTTWLDACFVADRALTERLPLRELVDPKQKSPADGSVFVEAAISKLMVLTAQ